MVVAAALITYKLSTDPLRARESFDAGTRLMSVARYHEAILSFDRAIGLKRNFTDAWLMRARAYVALYEPARAIQDFDRAIQLRPRDAHALLERGRSYLLLQNYPAAIADATAAIGIDPQLASAYNLRGTALRETGNPRGALEDFNRAVERAPDADNYYQRGATHQILGEHELAIADFTQTIAFQPYLAQGYFARAESERAIGKDGLANEDHLKGRTLDGR